jgi:hypothetical protein
MRGGLDDPDMSLQSTAALSTSPLHDGFGFIGGDIMLPRLPPLDAVVIPIALGNNSLLMLCLARSTPLLRGRLVTVEDRLLRERCLGWHEVHAPQLRKQRAGESANVEGPREDQHHDKEAQINEKLVGRSSDLPISWSPHWGASGEALSATMNRSTS